MLTPERVYVFNVLAMGLCNAGDLFKSVLQDLLSGLPGVKILQMTSLCQHKKSMMPMSSDSWRGVWKSTYTLILTRLR